MRQIISTDEETEIILQRDGKPTMVVLSFQRYQALQRELEALRQGARPDIARAAAEFRGGVSLEELARRKGVRLVARWEDLLGPEPPVGEESVDEFLAELRRQREEDIGNQVDEETWEGM